MKLIESLPENPHLSDLFQKYNKGIKPLLEYHDILLREDSFLSIRQREIIAAYVSALNACSFCFGAHKRIVENFGGSKVVLEEIIDDIKTSSIEEEMKPILEYVKILTLEPSKITKELIDNIKNVGWTEEAIFDIASICALFNFMNRIVEGMGIVPSSVSNMTKNQNPTTHDYRNFGKKFGIT